MNQEDNQDPQPTKGVPEPKYEYKMIFHINIFLPWFTFCMQLQH